MRHRTLLLEDLANLSEESAIDYIADQFKVLSADLGIAELLVGYISVGAYGCDSSAWILFRGHDGLLYEVSGSHCSCYGFEGRWEPAVSSIEYLKSDKFYFSTGGYDESDGENKKAVSLYLADLV